MLTDEESPDGRAGEAVLPQSPAANVRSEPAREYQTRRQRRLEQAERLSARERLVGNGRLAVFVAALIVGYLAFLQLLSYWWLLPLFGLFVVLIFVHES